MLKHIPHWELGTSIFSFSFNDRILVLRPPGDVATKKRVVTITTTLRYKWGMTCLPQGMLLQISLLIIPLAIPMEWHL